MRKYPDFSELGYQVIQELGRNREAGRITYLAHAQNLNEKVVIKEFRFADSSADWTGFKAYEREIEVLQQLNHPCIPRYLNSFETPQGFCLVQEYKKAPSLAERHSFNPEEIKQIAVSVLEILVYLQQRVPPIIHRDIKPENILVDEQLNAYLVDFGLARIRSGEVALSSVAAGTPGFMPPEEHFGRPLTPASDLYSLGATLLCLLNGTRSLDIGKLIDDNYRFNLKPLSRQISPRLVEWLIKMVEPNLKNRYGNAAIALKALKPISVVTDITRQEIPNRAIKLNKPVAVLGVVGISFAAAGVVQAWQIPHRLSSVKQLLAINECVSCNLHHAKLQGANLGSANLKKANLQFASLEFANLGNANLREAFLDHAKLGSANLGNANLKGAKLGNANLGSANLGSANLHGAYLNGANLADANLEGANLRGVSLANATLADANLQGANLRGVYLNGADLRGANLKNANLKGVNLKDAKLKGAIMPDGTIHQK